ncbi:MAG: DUF4430 domain-containing protein [Eubacterium sp.]|nr:DUF4430 domain-containing protein [Eubacterium sp.]
MNRRITAVLALLLAAAMLFGCGRAGESNDQDVTLTEFSTSAAKQTTTGKTTVTSTAKNKKSTTKKAEKKSDKNTSEKASVKDKTTLKAKKKTDDNKAVTSKKAEITTKAESRSTTAKRNKVKPYGSKKARTTTQKNKTTAAKPTAHKPEKTTAAPTKSRVEKTKITVTIQCKEVLSNLDKLKEGHEQYVPKSGYFITGCAVDYEKGDTVYTVLKRVCRETGIKMRARRTVYGMYIVGLNELDEKDCGGTSGWTYYVDGEFPMVSVDNYALNGGENIEFKYVV